MWARPVVSTGTAAVTSTEVPPVQLLTGPEYQIPTAHYGGHFIWNTQLHIHRLGKVVVTFHQDLWNEHLTQDCFLSIGEGDLWMQRDALGNLKEFDLPFS